MAFRDGKLSCVLCDSGLGDSLFDIDPSLPKDLIYDAGGNLVQVKIYQENAFTTLLFTKDFTYTDGNLTEVKITRAVDGYLAYKYLFYDVGGNLDYVWTDDAGVPP